MKAIFIALVVIVIVAGGALGAWFFLHPKLNSSQEIIQEEKTVKELPLEKRPYTTLTPDPKGQELQMSVIKIPSEVSTLEYELTYTAQAPAPNTGEITQGVPGSIKLNGQTELNRKLTLGTCSSGVCRYDKGVKDINLTLKLRDDKGKLIGKTSSEIVLETDPTELMSADGVLKIDLAKNAKGVYVLMNTMGLPAAVNGHVAAGPYGIFSSNSKNVPVTVIISKGTLNQLYLLPELSGSSWKPVNGKAQVPGVFVGINQ